MATLPNFTYPQTEPFNFLGLDEQNYQKATVAILPVPYDSTTYWKSGTKDGPRAIIEASRHLELWDQELKQDISKVGIYTLPELAISKNSPKETLDIIEKVVSKILKNQKFPFMFGGEHSITFGAVWAASKKIKNLSVLHLDAHTDLRLTFEGTKYHHACYMRRIVEDLKLSATHVGIRSMSEEEVQFLKTSQKNHVFYAPDMPIDQIIETLSPTVYITIDLDALDTSIMPAVGTPEPGGMGWYEMLELLKAVTQKRTIIGADIVELDPIPGMNAPDFLAAKLAYKLIGYAHRAYLGIKINALPVEVIRIPNPNHAMP